MDVNHKIAQMEQRYRREHDVLFKLLMQIRDLLAEIAVSVAPQQPPEEHSKHASDPSGATEMADRSQGLR